MKLECSFVVYSHGVDLFIEAPYLAPLVGVGGPHAGRADLVKLEHVGILVPGAQVAAPVEISQSCVADECGCGSQDHVQLTRTK